MRADHTPVLLQEAVDLLDVQPEQWYVDATFGRGGHTEALLKKGAQVLAFDWDAEAIEYGENHFQNQIATGTLLLVRDSFANLKQLVESCLSTQVAGVLFDFGTSSGQLTSAERGFSFTDDGQLDMRMDTRKGVKAKDILNAVPAKQLELMFREYGGEEKAHAIAKAVKAQSKPIETTQQLAELVSKVKHGRTGKLHPATKVFQALRIAVNSELEEIAQALPQALHVTESSGHIVTIAFHEGEDRLVKQAFKSWETQDLGENLTKKPVTPSDSEVEKNQRARSAKLRAFKKKET